MNLAILERLNHTYKGLKISLIVLYSFTFIPLAYVFTMYLEHYWYYYTFTFMLAILSSWIFYNVVSDVLSSGTSVSNILVEYQSICLIICILFIVLPLIIVDYANFLSGAVIDFMFLDFGAKYPGYSGPQIILSCVIFFFFFNFFLFIDYFKNKVR